MVKPAVWVPVAWCVTVAQPAGSGPGCRLTASTICSVAGGRVPADPDELTGGLLPPCPDGVLLVLCRSSTMAPAPAPAPSTASSTRAIHMPVRRLRGAAGRSSGRDPLGPLGPLAPGGAVELAR